MKRTLLSMLAAALSAAAVAQSSHELSLHGGGGLSALRYSPAAGSSTLGAGGQVGLGYAYHFSKQWGLLTGVGATLYRASAAVNGVDVATRGLYNRDGSPLELHATLSGHSEAQQAAYLSIPLQARFSAGRFYAQAGLSLGIPLAASYRTAPFTITTRGYYPDVGSWGAAHDEHLGYGTYPGAESSGALSLKVSAAIALEAGLRWTIAEKWRLYAGLCFGYGLSDVGSGAAQPFVPYSPQQPTAYHANSVLQSIQVDKLSTLTAGVAVRIGFGFTVAPRIPRDSQGRPLDSDGDGVPDHLDVSPSTPAGIAVDSLGCPPDSDGDGVPDYRDSCPHTLPAGAPVDSLGCLLDSDGDGVFDYLDTCPHTPPAVPVNSGGCPLDSDGDGVPDYCDSCPHTLPEVKGLVDSLGCPRDSDGDSILDYLDNCPKLKGPAENHGCPIVEAAVRRLFEKALSGIEFESGRPVLKAGSSIFLDQVVKVMRENPDYVLLISGHSDNVGKPEDNQQLSEARASSVKAYLEQQGIAGDRMMATGYGDTLPIATNDVAAGRAKNRRVELSVKFER